MFAGLDIKKIIDGVHNSEIIMARGGVIISS